MSLDAQTFTHLFKLSRDAVIGVDEDQKISFANPVAELQLGVRAGDPAAALLPKAILSDPALRFISSARIRNQIVHISAVRTGGVTIFTLVLPAKQTEESPLSHERILRELGNDLLSARLALDAIVKGTGAEEDEKLRIYAGILYRSYYRIKRLQEHMGIVSSLRQRSLPFSPRLTALDDLCKTLCDSVDVLVRSMGIRVSFSFGEDDYHAIADRDLMEKLLLNLLTNSLLHASEGDTIHMSLSLMDRRFVIAVDDPGRGMSSDRLAELFAGLPEKDRTDTAAGAGLGLLLVRGIAELHGGSLILESREDAGTRTRIWLPQPGPEDLQLLRQPDTVYRTDGMSTLLTELSVVLDKSWYNSKTFD